MKKILTIAVTYAALRHRSAKKEIHAPDRDILVDENDIEKIAK